jgi:thiosulfate reductase cytochrome b subunit
MMRAADQPPAPSRSGSFVMSEAVLSTRAHPMVVRLTHWINAAAVGLMIGSGWRIYNASPLFGFTFPAWLTLGGWLGGALAIHFAAMWLLVANFAVYVAYGVATGHLRRRLLPIRLADVRRDFVLALAFRLAHQPGVYNAVQRLLYVLVGLAIAGVILSGLAVWKPVQLHLLAMLLGGYEGARLVHFLAMSSIAAFLVIHLALVAIVPRTLRGMLTGGSR